MSSVEHITSRQNPLVGHIRRLNASRAYRRERGEFVCDGPKLLAEALRWGAEITAVVAEEGRSVPCPPGAREVSVPPELLKSLSTTETPQGVLFLCRAPDLSAPDKLTGTRYLVLDGVQDPGNVYGLAHSRRLRSGQAHPAARLCGPLFPQNSPGYHGGLFPSSRLGNGARDPDRPPDRRGAPTVRHCAAGGY